MKRIEVHLATGNGEKDTNKRNDMNAKTILDDLRAVASEEKRAVLSRFFKSGTVSTVNIITRLARQNSATAISKSSFYMSDDRADLLCGKISGIIIAL